MELPGGYTLIGRQDVSVDGRTDVDTLLSQVPDKDFRLLLDHQPVDLQENAEAGIDLQLSGHTHAGQIWPMGFLSKLVGVNEEYYGLHDIKDFKVIVSSGMAGWGVSDPDRGAVRVCCHKCHSVCLRGIPAYC